MTIPPRFLDDLRARLSLSDVIGKRVRLIRAGREFKGCCPFHREKSPSFTVNDDKQFFHCFGCGAHGDVIGFTMRHDNLSFIDAIETLAAQAGLKVPEQSPQDIKKAEKARDLHALMDAAARWMEDQLHAPANREILKYLTDRGLTKETIQNFRVGFAPGDFQSLRTFLKTEKFSDEQMIEAGLLKKSDKGKEPYAFFRERVMFPVSDRRGRIVAFGGRILPDNMRAPDKGDFKPPKYINSSDTPLFDKSRTLYGQSFARQAAANGATILVTEGYMDVIACHQAGFNGAVAPMGTALTEDQIVMLWNMITSEEKIPVLCFDGDNAGRGAAARACERLLPLLKPYHTARFAFLPNGEDPDSLIKSGGPQAFQNILESSIPLFEFLWYINTAGRNFDSPESRAGLTQTLENAIKTINDREIQKHYLAQIKQRIYETFLHNSRSGGGGSGSQAAGGYGGGGQSGNGAYRQGSNRTIGGHRGVEGRVLAGGRNNKQGYGRMTPVPIKPKAPVTFTDIHERALIAAIINHPHIFETVEDMLGHFDFRNAACNRLRQAIVNVLASDPALDAQALRNHLESQGFDKETGDIVNESVYVHASFASPSADAGSVASTWIAYCQDIQQGAHRQEMQSGWKQAFLTSNEEDEEKLKAMMDQKANDGR